jgi:hypothetical protein
MYMEMFEEKPWYVTDPSGVEVFIMSLAGFCKKHKLDKDNMRKVANGIRSHHMGYKVRKASWSEMQMSDMVFNFMMFTIAGFIVFWFGMLVYISLRS